MHAYFFLTFVSYIVTYSLLVKTFVQILKEIGIAFTEDLMQYKSPLLHFWRLNVLKFCQLNKHIIMVLIAGNADLQESRQQTFVRLFDKQVCTILAVNLYKN